MLISIKKEVDKALTEFVIIGYTSSAENAEDLKEIIAKRNSLYRGNICYAHGLYHGYSCGAECCEYVLYREIDKG